LGSALEQAGRVAAGRRRFCRMKILVVACCDNEGEKIQDQFKRHPRPRDYDPLVLAEWTSPDRWGLYEIMTIPR
jgi:hypothetical protein